MILPLILLAGAPYQYAFTVWDLDSSYRDLAFFKRQVDACVVHGFNLLEEPLDAGAILMPFATVLDGPVRDRIRALSLGTRCIADEQPGQYVVGAQFQGLTGAPVVVTGKPFTQDDRVPAKLVALGEANDRRLRVAAVQFETTFDVKENTARILDYLRQAASKNVRAVAFTEMALTGYTKEAAFRDEVDWETVGDGLAQIRRACKELGLYAIVGAPTRDEGTCYCSAVAIGPAGEVIDVYEKVYRAGEKWAEAGRRLSTFDIDGTRCASLICHDSRYGALVQLRTLAGTQIFFYIASESGLEAENKIGPYRAQIQARAAENGVYIVQANTPANPDDPAAKDRSHGQSRIVAPDGNIIAEAPVYGDTMVIADIDPRHTRRGGLRAALTEGPLAQWMQEGVEKVIEPENR